MMESGMLKPLWENGPTPGALYNFPGKVATDAAVDMKKHTLNPMTTGTSVLGLQFDGGVILAADMLGSYGSLARFRNIERLVKVNDCTMIGASGDIADFQFLSALIQEIVTEEACLADGFGFTPRSLQSWLTRVMYNRRSKFDPLWNTILVAGIQDGQPYLGYVDKIGVAYTAPSIATGYGAYIAQPLLREQLEKNVSLSEQQAREVMDGCLKVLFYRDARSFNQYQLATVTKDGVRVEGPLKSDANWDIAHLVKGFE